MKGIILAGGSGTRLYPLTKVISKQLLPIYNKPMIYYPLSILMLAKIKDILIISTPIDLPNFKKLLGDGTRLGLKISYEIQEKPEGLAQAFLIGEKFIGNDSVAMILGDNLFYGNGLKKALSEAVENTYKNVSTVFAYHVKNPSRFGVVEFDINGKALSIEEKPNKPKSNFAVTGLYFYDNRVVKFAKKIKKSLRNEYEITDLNAIYLNKNSLNVCTFGRGFTWFDSGTHDSLSKASDFVKIIEKQHGLMISCPEEIAYKNKWISRKELELIIKQIKNNKYGLSLLNLLKGNSKSYEDS